MIWWCRSDAINFDSGPPSQRSPIANVRHRQGTSSTNLQRLQPVQNQALLLSDNLVLGLGLYAAKWRELTQLHNGVARGNGLILCAQLFTSECFKCSVKFRDMTQHYRHYITMTTRFAFGCSHNVMWTRANCPVFPPKDRKERMVRRRMQGVCLPSC